MFTPCLQAPRTARVQPLPHPSHAGTQAATLRAVPLAPTALHPAEALREAQGPISGGFGRGRGGAAAADAFGGVAYRGRAHVPPQADPEGLEFLTASLPRIAQGRR